MSNKTSPPVDTGDPTMEAILGPAGESTLQCALDIVRVMERYPDAHYANDLALVIYQMRHHARNDFPSATVPAL